MRISKILYVSTFTICLLFLPVLSSANKVPWSTEQYRARAAYSSVIFGPPLPVTADWTGMWPYDLNYSRSEITSTYMNVVAQNNSADYPIGGMADFSGTYIAQTANPLFQFTYDGYYTSVDPGIESEHYAWLTVTDLSTSTVLFNNSSLTLDNKTQTIAVPTISGNEIAVEFGVNVLAIINSGMQTEMVKLNYSTAVAPEPLSYVLFIFGGTLLAGRRYIKRNRLHNH